MTQMLKRKFVNIMVLAALTTCVFAYETRADIGWPTNGKLLFSNYATSYTPERAKMWLSGNDKVMVLRLYGDMFSSGIFVQKTSLAGNLEYGESGLSLGYSSGNYSAALDTYGGIYVAGYSCTSIRVMNWTTSGLLENQNTSVSGYYNYCDFSRDPQIIYNGDTDVLLAWKSRIYSPAYYRIKVHKLNQYLEPVWNYAGVTLCAQSSDQNNPQVIADDNNGMFVTWEDARSANWDVYIQRVDKNGNLLWVTSGLPVCTEASDQTSHRVISDNAGGAIVIWQDARNGGVDLYAQRIDSTGVAQWTVNGVKVCNTTMRQLDFDCGPDGSGGLIAVWRERRGTDYDIYAQLLNANGQLAWGTTGLAVCTASQDQIVPRCDRDGQGGAYFAWQDYRNSEWDIYANRVSAAGVSQWQANGQAVCNASASQLNPSIIKDQVNGLMMCWEDFRNTINASAPLSYPRIYALRLGATGAIEQSPVITPALPQGTPRELKKASPQPNPFLPTRGQMASFLEHFNTPPILGEDSFAVRIFNAHGRLVRTLSNVHVWDGKDENGTVCPGGVYLYQIEFNKQRVSGEVVLIK